jgi:glycosyltransferase involved in cell wall biosynthesis
MHNIMFASNCHYLMGDINGAIAAINNLPKENYRISTCINPNSEIHSAINKRDGISIHNLNIDGELNPVSNQGKNLLNATKAAIQLSHFVKRHKIELIYTIDRTRVVKIIHLMHKLTNTPYVINCASPLFYKQPLSPSILRGASGVHCCSESIRLQLQPYLAPQAPSETIHYGLDLARFVDQGRREQIRRDLRITPDQVVVLLLGRYSPFKGHGETVEAVRRLDSAGNRLRVVMAGADTQDHVDGMGGSYRERLRKEIDAAGAMEQFRLLDNWPWHDLPQLITAADICIMPSWWEPFGLVALEAMAMGKPLISTRAGGVPEFVHDEHDGLLIAPRDAGALASALDRLITDTTLRQRLGDAARETVCNRHRVEHYGRRVGAFLERAINSSEASESRARRRQFVLGSSAAQK